MQQQVQLPADFLERMKKMLGEDYDAFINTYDDERAYGLRYNPLKITEEKACEIVDAITAKIPWTNEGFYYDKDKQPGKSPLHEAGAYYIQEPSAMSAAEFLDVVPGDIVCDLCAAPGGKSTQIAGKLMGQGLLVSNEFFASRAKILSSNIERLGVRNAVVINEDTAHVADLFYDFFDKVMVDAPCSGEGMFRKDEEARGEWSLEQVKVCADRQQDILNNAARIVKPGGVMVYSTCTFSREENEDTIDKFLEEHEDFYIEKPSIHDNLIKAGFVETDGMYRLWPNRLKGEGHFVTRLRRKDSEEEPRKIKYISGNAKKQDLCYFEEFAKKSLKVKITGEYVMFGDYIYLVPEKMINLKGVKVERAGLKLGCNKKNRFEPDHALALALNSDEVINVTECAEPDKYLRGETIPCEYDSGWTLVTVNGISIGWGKAQNGVLKNHYPKGLRR